MHSAIVPLCRLAVSTTLSGGTVFIVLDQDRNGTRVIIGCQDLYGRCDDELDRYCDAVERCLEQCEPTCCLVEIDTVRLQYPLRTLNGVTFARSRHAVVVYWNDGIWLWTKSGPAIHVDPDYLERRDPDMDVASAASVCR